MFKISRILKTLSISLLFLAYTTSFALADGAYYDASSFINPVKEKLQRGEMAFGAYLTIPDEAVIENLSYPKKLDFIWIDAEHTSYGPETVQRLVIAAENRHVLPITRVPDNGIEAIKKYIATGVMGIVVPNIKSAEDAQTVVDSVKYPPEGRRHVGPERATGYLANLAQYMQNANKQTLVIVMIESKEAISDIDRILQVKGIDIAHMGPYDLSQSMGVPINSPELKAAVLKVEQEAKKYNIPLGTAVSNYAQARELYKRGYRFFTIPGDMDILRKGVENFFTTPGDEK